MKDLLQSGLFLCVAVLFRLSQLPGTSEFFLVTRHWQRCITPRAFLRSRQLGTLMTSTTGESPSVGNSPDFAKHSEKHLPARRVLSLFGEPMLHFFVIGALIFGADRVLHPPTQDDKVIVVTKALKQSFIENFDEDKAREPTETELKQMVESWVASEILYREGKLLAVDRGDEMIRDRIAFKLQVLIFDQARVPEPTDDELRQWFAANHAQFDEPERVGFLLTPPTDEATARSQLHDIQSMQESDELQKVTRAILARPVASLGQSFGEGFRDALLTLPLHTWSVVQSKDGWHVVRLDSRRPGEAATLEGVRDQAVRQYKTEATRLRAWDAVNRLKAGYTVREE